MFVTFDHFKYDFLNINFSFSPQKDGVSPLDNQTGAISRKSHNRSYNHGVCSMNQSLFNQLNCSFPINNRYFFFHLVCAFSWFCRTCLCVFIYFFFFFAFFIEWHIFILYFFLFVLHHEIFYATTKSRGGFLERVWSYQYFGWRFRTKFVVDQ